MRCAFEYTQHSESCWVTLTYDDDHVPVTLSKSHLSGFLKRLRARMGRLPVKFFASGEYGERTHRPHYHAILYGMRGSSYVQASWPFGFAREDELSPASIAYVAGYCSKKIGWARENQERVDYSTGEVYTWQAPFLQMSLRPPIADKARQFVSDWRSTAIYHGREVPVPRFLHKAWLDAASDREVEILRNEKSLESVKRWRWDQAERRKAGEALAISSQYLTSLRRAI